MLRGTRTEGRGFTLIEVIIVLAILSVILTMLAPMAFQLFTAERGTAVQNELQELYRAVVGDPGKGLFGYVGDVGKYPAGLMDLWVQPKDSTGTPLPGWKGPYLENPRAETGVLLDPFGRPFEYLLANAASGAGNVFAVISRGPDGVSTNTATNPNVANNYVGALPTDTGYPTTAQNTDNVVYPSPSNPNALNQIVSGDVALNILNYDANPKVNAFVPACPQLFNVTATSVPRGTEDISGMPYTQGLSFDLVQGQYRLKIVPQGQTTVSWTETVTVLPAATLTRTLNLTGLDSSGTQQFVLTVKNGYTATEVEVFEFDQELSGAAVGSTSYSQGSLKPGVTQNYLPHACAQVYVRKKGSSSDDDNKNVASGGVIAQFVMPYGASTRIIGANAASVTVVNKVEKRLKVFRNNVLIGTVPRGDVHDDEGESHPHIKTKTFTDLTAGDVITIFSVKENVSTLLATVTLAVGSNTVTLQ